MKWAIILNATVLPSGICTSDDQTSARFLTRNRRRNAILASKVYCSGRLGQRSGSKWRDFSHAATCKSITSVILTCRSPRG